MTKVMTSKAFASKAREIATKYLTSYMLGPWGWPANDEKITRATTNGSNAETNKQWLSYAYAIKDKGFLFDCVGLIKGIIWGWCGDLTRAYGGAGYETNGLKDIDAGAMIKICDDVSTDFSAIVPGEAVYMPGHIGIYVGGGVVSESTPRWNWGVQLSTCSNVSKTKVSGTVGARTWTSHGKLPWIDYSDSDIEEEDENMTQETFKAKWQELRKELQAAPASSWSEEALQWAEDNGIMLGDDKGNLLPLDLLTREQMAVMLYRFAQWLRKA